VSQRIELDTVHGAKADTFAPCTFAEGKTGDAPACSAALVLSTAVTAFEREAVAGVLDTGRYRMPYYVWGEGPPLVLVHGLCDDSATFALPLSRLRQHFCCVVYDLPTGNGDGARLSRYSPDALVSDLLALCDHLHLDATALLGVSFGSTIALRALAREPKRFPTAVLQGGFAYRPLAWTEVLLARLARYWPGTVGQLPLWMPIIQQQHAAEFAGLEPSRWDFYLAHNAAVRNAAVAHRSLWLHATDLRPILPQIRQRILLICGDRDRIVGRACAEDLLRGLPNAARAEIEGCGHLPQFTHPEVYAEIIEQFLGSKDH
jgi:pimeloyl-ACP methyl ester carboxylesterase